MGWRAITKDGEELYEATHARPVQAGEEGNLLVIAQEDYLHSVAVDLINGIVIIDYDSLGVQNGDIEISGGKLRFLICDETNIVGEFKHLEQKIEDLRDEDGRRVLHDGRYVKVRTDILHPLVWRPIWFSRHISALPAPVKVIGAQVTLPKDQGGKNVKKMISLFPDGQIGID